MIWFRVPGPLGLSPFSGRPLFGNAAANLATKGGRKAAAKFAGRELGRAISKIAFSKRTVRFIGKQWQRALAHIGEHFSARTALAAGRKTAGIFLERFRNPGGVQQLIKQAVKKPSNRLFTKAKIHVAEHIGQPVVIVEREFSFVVGEAFKEVGGVIVKDSEKVIEHGVERVIWNGDCKVLRVVFNRTGDIITSYPVRAINWGL
jgi:hypothetical protein